MTGKATGLDYLAYRWLMDELDRLYQHERETPTAPLEGDMARAHLKARCLIMEAHEQTCTREDTPAKIGTPT